MVKEYALAYKNNYSSSSYAQHLINHSHSLVHMEDVVGVIFTTPIGRHLDTVERCRIYQKTEKCMQINDKSTITENKM